MSFSLVSAANPYFSNIALNRVIEVNGLSFLKTGSDKYQMIVPTNFPEYMQDFTSAHCAQLPMPICVTKGDCTINTDINELYTQGPVLKDKRDHRSYEIRKYADGQCWMADDLKFGGTTSSVAGTPTTLLNNYCTTRPPKWSHSGTVGIPNPNNWYDVDENGVSTGVKLWGDCYNPGPMNEATGTVATGTTAVAEDNGWQYAAAETGYFYDWTAAVQEDAYTIDAIGARKVQGICPRGWHLPASDGDVTEIAIGATPNTTSSNAGGCNTIGCVAASVNDFKYLDQLYGGKGGLYEYNTHAHKYFWGMPADVAALDVAWNGVYPGCSGGSSSCVSRLRGNSGRFYTSAAQDLTQAFIMATGTSGFSSTAYNNNRGYGYQVRCITD